MIPRGNFLFPLGTFILGLSHTFRLPEEIYKSQVIWFCLTLSKICMTSTTLILFIKICKCRSFCQTFGLDVKQNQMRSSITRSGTKYQNNYITTSIFLEYTYDKNKNVIECTTTTTCYPYFKTKMFQTMGFLTFFLFGGNFFSDKNQQI